MAIIKGVTAAKVGEVNPYMEDIAGMSAAITARETRANEIRDSIAANKAAMLKETRDNTEDWELAQQIEKSFSDATGKMVDAADKDYSTISRDELQNLAIEYAGRTDFRMLGEAKRNADEYTKAMQTQHGANGDPVTFGIDPTKAGLYNDDGSVNHMTGKWEVQKRENYSQAAKKLYDNIGSTLGPNMEKYSNIIKEEYGTITNGDGTISPNWAAYWEKTGKHHKDNINQVDAIIRGALESFKQDPEGKQYFRIHFEQFKKDNPNATEQEAMGFADEKVQQLIMTYGKSEYNIEDKQTASRQLVGKAQPGPKPPAPRSGGKGSGSGNKEEVRVPVPKGRADNISYTGYSNGEKEVFATYQQNISKNVNLSDVSALVNSDSYAINAVENNKMLVGSALLVSNPEGNSKGTNPDGMGFLQITGEKVKGGAKKNPSAIHFKHINKSVEPETYASFRNTIPANYEQYTVTDGKVSIPNADPNQPPQLLNVNGLVRELGDDLFTYDELREAGVGVNGNDLQLQDIMKKDKPQNLSLSMFDVSTVNGKASINPMLSNLREIYRNGLTNAEDDATKMLYEAKLKKLDEKEAEANDLMITRSSDFTQLEHRIQLNNQHNKMLAQNIMEIGDSHGVPEALVKTLLDPTGEGSKEFVGKVNEAKNKAAESISLDKESITNLSATNGNANYSEEDNKKYISMLKGMWELHKNKLMNNEYNTAEVSTKSLIDGTPILNTNKAFTKLVRSSPELVQYLSKWKTSSDTYLDAVRKVPKGQEINRLNELGSVDGQHESRLSKNFTFDPNGKLVINSEAKSLYDQTQNTSLQQSFKTQGDVAGFVKSVETMNDVMNRNGVRLFKANPNNNEKTGWAESTFEQRSIKDERGLLSDGKKWRNAQFSTPSGEEMNITVFQDHMMNKYNKLKEENQVGNLSYPQWEKKELDSNTAYRGIRLDTDNDSGSLFVAHYQYDGYSFEHDIEMNRSDGMKYFGIPALYYTLGRELTDGLAANRNMYADFQGMGSNKPVRLHQALTDLSGGPGTNGIARGQYYILSKSQNLGDDPNAGSSEYHPHEDGIHKIPFASYDDFFDYHAKRYSNERYVQTQLSNQISMLVDQKLELEDVFPESHQFMKNYRAGLASKESIISDLNTMLTKAAGGTNFNSASSLQELSTTGVVQGLKYKDGSEKYYIPNNQFNMMSNADKKNVAFVANPKLKNQTWFTDNQNEDYLADPNSLVDLTNDLSNGKLSNIRYKGLKMKLNPVTSKFVQGMSDINTSFGQSEILKIQGIKQEDLNLLNTSEPITITSALRSVQDNLRAYNAVGNGDISKITVSPHMAGKSIDIRTESGNTDYKGGQALWEFLKTPSGSAFLKHYGMRAFYHNVKNGGLHIDISQASSTHPAGKVFERIDQGEIKTYHSGK